MWNNTVDAQCFVVERASSMLFEWEATCQARNTHVSQGNQTLNIKWTKPYVGRMKCNIDTSFPNHDNKVGI